MKFSLNFKLIFKIYSYIMIIVGVAMIPSVITAYIYNEPAMIGAFLSTSFLMIAIGCFLLRFLKPKSSQLKLRDGYLIVGIGWVVTSLIGCIPYLLSGYTDSFAAAFFESTAGFTTTGATVLNIDVMPKSILMWKAICHWLGGMGILVFMVSLLPALGVGGQNIMKAEVPGIKVDKITSRTSDSAKILYAMYIGLTLLEFILLLFTEISVFDNIVTSLGSISTGGLFAHSSGIAYFNSVYIEIVIAVCTLLSAVNYSLYPLIAKGEIREVLRNAELKVYIGIIGIATAIITASLYLSGTYSTIGNSLRYAFFQVTAFSTTSGYTLTDYGNWPSLCIAVLFILMFIGGCASSTAGSVKVVRIMVLFKMIARTFYTKIHPRAVVTLKLGKQPIHPSIISQITSFVLTFIIVLFLGTWILSLQGFDLITNLSTSLSMLSNTGIALGEVGASGNFGIYSPPLQIVLSIMMILGRLEILTLLILFMPSFWNADKAID